MDESDRKGEGGSGGGGWRAPSGGGGWARGWPAALAPWRRLAALWLPVVAAVTLLVLYALNSIGGGWGAWRLPDPRYWSSAAPERQRLDAAAAAAAETEAGTGDPPLMVMVGAGWGEMALNFVWHANRTRPPTRLDVIALGEGALRELRGLGIAARLHPELSVDAPSNYRAGPYNRITWDKWELLRATAAAARSRAAGARRAHGLGGADAGGP